MLEEGGRGDGFAMDARVSPRPRFGADGRTAREHDFICAICHGRSGRSPQERAARTVRAAASGVISFARFRSTGGRGTDLLWTRGRGTDLLWTDGRGADLLWTRGCLLGGPFVVDRRAALERDFICAICHGRTAVSSAAISDGRTGGGVTRFHLRDLKAPGEGGRICYGRAGVSSAAIWGGRTDCARTRFHLRDLPWTERALTSGTGGADGSSSGFGSDFICAI